jgi:hypothetical protein
MWKGAGADQNAIYFQPFAVESRQWWVFLMLMIKLRFSKGSDARITPSGASNTPEAEAAPSKWVN